MTDRKTAKKIAHAILDASTVEEIALRFAALGLNFPDDPFSRCRLLDGYVLRRRNFRNRAVAKELTNIARSKQDFSLTTRSPYKAILEKVAAYAAESVDLTDQQANQIFYELIYAAKPVAVWRKLALAQYWRKKGKRVWLA